MYQTTVTYISDILTSSAHCGCDTPASPVNCPVGESSARTLPCIMNPLKSGLSMPPKSVTGLKEETHNK